ncbi:MAG: KpsF/GutQ family sugar-phosphate isomerase [Candidatus Omnitrophica bacterium]|nr:KpsF/GutQ family sugar-phosphate isomerase [Candidatus Omnitrophota bacterium]
MSLKRAKEVIAIEADAIKKLIGRIDKNFEAAVDLIAQCKGRVIISGMGKTGLIGRKIAATLSSTGTPAMFMHSAEAVHGDLGQVTRLDVLIVISQSGETEETVRLLPLIKRIGTRVIAITGNPMSSLAKHSDVVLNVNVQKEGCPLGLAPMASTTATLVMGDALAACLIDRKNFKREDFAFFHPGGSLGRQLLLKVSDIMRTGNRFARVTGETKVKDVLLEITKTRCGSACVVDKSGKILGFFTDGDLRRHLEEDSQLLTRKVKDVMTAKPMTIRHDRLAAEAFDILKERRFDELPVVDQKGKLVGLLDVQDLLKAGLV